MNEESTSKKERKGHPGIVAEVRAWRHEAPLWCG